MTVQPIRLFGDPVLRTPAAEVVDFDKELALLVQDLWDTMESQNGAGLAAPQLGVGLRVFTYHCDGVAGDSRYGIWRGFRMRRRCKQGIVRRVSTCASRVS